MCTLNTRNVYTRVIYCVHEEIKLMDYETLRDFRANISTALDGADEGKDIFIHRGDKVYQVVRLVAKMEPIKPIAEYKQVQKPATQSISKVYSAPYYIDPTTGESVYEQTDLVKELNKRTIGAILTEITNTKSTMDAEVLYCQDTETKAQIQKKYNSIIQGLWDEYNEAKK